MRQLLLLSVIFWLGCGGKKEGDKPVALEKVPKLGGLKALNSDSDLVKVFQLDKLYQEQKYAQVLSAAKQYVQKYPYEGKGWQVLGNAQLALKQNEDASPARQKFVSIQRLFRIL